MIRRSPSLFITFALAFFAVLLLAFLLQGWIFADLVRPLLVGWERGRIEDIASAAAEQLSEGYGELANADIEALLSQHGDPVEGLVLVFARPQGPPLSNRPLDQRHRRALRFYLERGFPRDHGPPPFGPRGEPHPDGQPRRDLSSRREIYHDGERVGELVAFLPPGMGPRSGGPGNPRVLILFLPLAFLLAGLAGLLSFRLLTRRLRSLEELAEQVSRGNLEARVEDLGRDEIGRLGARLNEMTANLGRAQGIIAANDAQRRRLLADISHELATPLTSIRGYTETLLDPGIPVNAEERAKYLGHVNDEATRMGALIDDLLELSRLESGAVVLEKERLDLAALVRNSLERYRKRFADAGLEAMFESEEDELWIEADGRRLEQVLDNLLVNALRHVPAGCRVELFLDRDDAGSVRLCVSDNGPGFKDEDLPHLFERFYRAERSRSGEGSGLGLAIVREILLRHGGRVSARRREGGGAIIEIVLSGSTEH